MLILKGLTRFAADYPEVSDKMNIITWAACAISHRPPGSFRFIVWFRILDRDGDFEVQVARDSKLLKIGDWRRKKKPGMLTVKLPRCT